MHNPEVVIIETISRGVLLPNEENGHEVIGHLVISLVHSVEIGGVITEAVIDGLVVQLTVKVVATVVTKVENKVVY